MLIVFVVALALGFSSYNHKLAKTKAEAQVFSEEESLNEAKQAKAEAQAKEKAKEEEKKRFEQHKGEKLIYSPMGDSLAKGAFATTEDKRYVAVLAKEIEQKLGYDVVVKKGVTYDGTGVKDGGLTHVSQLVSESPDLVTIEYGVNDANKNQKKAYTTPEEFKKNLSTLVDDILSKSTKKPIIILTTTWNNGENSKLYDPIIAKVAEDKNIPLANIIPVWQYRNDTFGPEGRKTVYGTSDAWHPNDKGHKEIAESIFEVAKKELK